MLGHKALWESWKTQWGPQPVRGLHETGADDRFAPITLPGGAGIARRRRAARRTAMAAVPGLA